MALPEYREEMFLRGVKDVWEAIELCRKKDLAHRTTVDDQRMQNWRVRPGPPAFRRSQTPQRSGPQGECRVVDP